MRHVTVVGYHKVLGTSITIPMEMLNAADLIQRIEGKDAGKLHMQLVSVDGANIRLTAGLELVCNTPLESIERTDLIIVPACGETRSASCAAIRNYWNGWSNNTRWTP